MHETLFFLWLYSPLLDLGRLTYRRFLELFRHMVGLLGRVVSPSQGLYLYRTTQHRKTRTNIHALSEIRNHDPSNQPAKTHASDRTTTVTGKKRLLVGQNKFLYLFQIEFQKLCSNILRRAFSKEMPHYFLWSSVRLVGSRISRYEDQFEGDSDLKTSYVL
jgi:hypothetical protein